MLLRVAFDRRPGENQRDPIVEVYTLSAGVWRSLSVNLPRKSLVFTHDQVAIGRFRTSGEPIVEVRIDLAEDALFVYEPNTKKLTYTGITAEQDGGVYLKMANVADMITSLLPLLIHERLPTQDRLSKWYPNRVMKCAMYFEIQDSHRHLFFKCQYSSQVWNKAVLKSKINNGNCDWKVILESMKRLPCKKNIWIVVNKLVFAATIYFLWQEKNIKQFQNVKRTWEELWKIIEENVKMKLLLGRL
ncbi:RNA-directed DNA polymerase, eukaryota, reverse transcriptase zinc-binding domain protein [Tanacetum coccineum]